jgi:hypothetical chaperone protein
MPAIGLDFGTTNSALCLAGVGEEPVMAQFADGAARTDTFRSVLFFNPELAGEGKGARSFAGPGAIREYLASGGAGRLIQSLKSFLADRSFQTTNIFGDIYRLEDLAALILVPLRAEAEEFLGAIAKSGLGKAAVVGRPVHFSSAADESDERLAQARLEVALKRAGFDSKQIAALKAAYRLLYRSGLKLEEALARIEAEISGPDAAHLVKFIRSSKRGICRE